MAPTNVWTEVFLCCKQSYNIFQETKWASVSVLWKLCSPSKLSVLPIKQNKNPFRFLKYVLLGSNNKPVCSVFGHTLTSFFVQGFKQMIFISWCWCLFLWSGIHHIIILQQAFTNFPITAYFRSWFLSSLEKILWRLLPAVDDFVGLPITK